MCSCRERSGAHLRVATWVLVAVVVVEQDEEDEDEDTDKEEEKVHGMLPPWDVAGDDQCLSPFIRVMRTCDMMDMHDVHVHVYIPRTSHVLRWPPMQLAPRCLLLGSRKGHALVGAIQRGAIETGSTHRSLRSAHACKLECRGSSLRGAHDRGSSALFASAHDRKRKRTPLSSSLRIHARPNAPAPPCDMQRDTLHVVRELRPPHDSSPCCVLARPNQMKV